MFSSFATLNWAINTIQACLSNAHTIVLVRDRKNSIFINNSAMFLEIISAVLIAIFLFLFSNQITYVYNLENDARNILSIILKLKAIQLPILAMSYVPKNILKVNEKTSESFLNGFNIKELNRDEKIRIEIYRMYVILKMIVDCKIKKYGKFDWMYDNLDSRVRALQKK